MWLFGGYCSLPSGCCSLPGGYCLLPIVTARFHFYRSSRPEVFCQKDVLRNFVKFTWKHLCQSLFFNKVSGLKPQACNFIKKETLAQVFFCEFCEISKNTFSCRRPLVAASAFSMNARKSFVLNLKSLCLSFHLLSFLFIKPYSLNHFNRAQTFFKEFNSKN